MKILVATKESQGTEKGDFCWADNGEPVAMHGFVCEENWDGPCGCGRAFKGLNSDKATTSAKIVDSELTLPELRGFVHNALIRSDLYDDDEFFAEIVDDTLDAMLEVADQFNVGDLIGRRVFGSDNSFDDVQECYLERNPKGGHLRLLES